MASASSPISGGPLRANYSSPNASKSFEYSLPQLSTQISTQEKTGYLSALRSSVVKLQEEVNTFLTAKMAEDKVTTSQMTGNVDDKKEEENYGEEVVQEDG